MTGFGRATVEQEGREMTVELKSVNHRYLDVGMRLPRALLFLEDAIRSALAKKLSRGHVDVFLNYKNNAAVTHSVELNEGLLSAYAKAADRAAELTGRTVEGGVMALLAMPDVVTVSKAEEDADAVSAICEEATLAAADVLIAMREKEGAQLRGDMLHRIGLLRTLLETVEQHAATVVADHKARLEARISELLDKAPLDEGRLANEVAIFADKSNITEEIVRLRSHLKQLEAAMALDEPVGRKLDFIVQECNREFNTIGSKANSLPITNAVMEAKGEIEKIREQVQNIE